MKACLLDFGSIEVDGLRYDTTSSSTAVPCGSGEEAVRRTARSSDTLAVG
jgi:hypothetical protein